MNSLDKNLIKSQNNTINFAISLLHNCSNILRHDQFLKNMSDLNFYSSSKKSDKAKYEKMIVYIRFINNFTSLVKFINKKLYQENIEDFKFFLGNIRSLIDMYGDFLFFSNENDDLAISYNTYEWLSILNRYYKIAKDTKLLKEEYDKYLDLYNKSDFKIYNFPNDISKFSKKGVQKINSIPSLTTEDIFKKPYFKTYSSATFSCWSDDSPENFYDKYYRIYSDYVHIKQHNQIGLELEYDNSFFHVVQGLYIMIMLFIELLDKNVFSNTLFNEYIKLNDKIQESFSQLKSEWNKRLNK